MARIRHIFQSAIIVLSVLGLNSKPLHTAARQAEEAFRRFSQPETANVVWSSNADIPETYALAAENTDFQLFVDQITLAFKVLDRRSGYIWHSNLDELAEGDRLNKTWTAFARSGISIDYLDQKAIGKRASITNTEHKLDVKLTGQGFEAVVTFLDPSITLLVMVKLEPTGVRVEVPFESIQEHSTEFKLGQLYVYPFFGATRVDAVSGYMFIPDGCGSLIRFQAATKAKNMFYGNYYGSDLGMLTTLPFDPTINRPYKITIPVIGMVHGEGQNAYVSIVEQGAAYGEVHAHPAGVITNFNFLYHAFTYNESYFQATNRSGAGVTTLQNNTNAFDVKIHYRFLTKDDSDYVGMAKSYQKYLIEQGALKKVSDNDSDIGIRLEFLGGDKERVLFWQRLISMTTVTQMSEILKGLGIKNPDVIYYGWQPLGAYSMPPKSLRLDGRLGNLGQLRSLIDDITAKGGRFYLYLDPQAAMYGEGGYSQRHDLAMSITNFNLQGYNRNKPNYYLNYDALSKRYAALSAQIFSELQAGLALDGIGSMLFSDFKRNQFVNREAAIRLYQELLGGNHGHTAFYMPNDYMFGYAQAYYDMPLTNSSYIYTTDVVPFLPIVFAGYVPYYGTALNFSSNSRDDLLRHADFGAYPSYFLSYDVTAKVLNTSSSWIYTSSYKQWAQEIEQTYRWLNDLLSPVKGQKIIARQVLAEGVTATTYNNGKQIIVNYSGQPFQSGEMVVDPKDAVIREVQP